MFLEKYLFYEAKGDSDDKSSGPFSYNLLSVMNKVGCANLTHGAAQILCQQMQQCGCNISLMAVRAACGQNPPAQESIQVPLTKTRRPPRPGPAGWRCWRLPWVNRLTAKTTLLWVVGHFPNPSKNLQTIRRHDLLKYLFFKDILNI